MIDTYDITLNYGSDFNRSFQVRDNDGVIINLSGYSLSLEFRNRYGNVILNTFTSTGGNLINGGSTGIITVMLTPTEIQTLSPGFYKLEATDELTKVTALLQGNVFINYEDKSPIDYLIPDLRLMVGDTNPDTYRYMDEWLGRSLILSIKSMRRYLGVKYIVDLNGIVSRDSTSTKFTTDISQGIIEFQDEYPILVKAAIIVLSGSLESSAWDLVSWKDAEISVSNQEVSKTKGNTIKDLQDELSKILVDPSKRLARPIKGSLPGYLGNTFEHKTEL
jgi:hypothetical protein